MTNEPATPDPSQIGIDFVPDTRDDIRDTPQETGVSLQTYGGWQTFDLLPPSYRDRRNAKRTLGAWAALVACLFALAVSSATARWISAQRTIVANQSLVARSEPLKQVRYKTTLLASENVRLEQWNAWLDSAKPGDDIVQILAAVAEATHPVERPKAQEHLDVRSIEVKLPLEYDGEGNAPSWAEPVFNISAVAKSRPVVMRWSQALERLDRLSEVSAKTPNGAWRESLIQVSADPIATRMVP